jgi:hypothetical protein
VARWLKLRPVKNSFSAVLLLALALPHRVPTDPRAATPSPSLEAPRVFLLDAQYLRAVRNRIRQDDRSLAPALEKLERDAKEASRAAAFSVVRKDATPPSGDKHDYMSQAPYFWRNPETTNGLPYVRRDGERNPELQKFPDHRVMDEMVNAVETLALAYYFKGDEAFATKAAALLRTWFLDPATRMNPHLKYAQAIPGVNDGRGIGLIETRGLTRVVDAIGLLAASKSWTDGDQRGLQEWFANFLQWMRASEHGHDEAAARNNHGTYYDVQVASFALFVDRKNLASDIVQAAPQKRIAKQIEPDGRQPLELARTKAWSYSIGNLDGLMLLARLAENVGVDLWNFETPDGRSIRKALDFLLPFAAGDQKWPYQQLGGFSPQTLAPVVRRAALKYPDVQYRLWLATIPEEDPANRSHLLRPQIKKQSPGKN